MEETHGAANALLGITHVFTFWQGMPSAAKCALGRMFAASATTVGLAIVDKGGQGGIEGMREKLVGEFQFGEDLVSVGTFRAYMYGSGHQKTAYIFKKQAGVGGEEGAVQGAVKKQLTTEMVMARQVEHAQKQGLKPPQPVQWMQQAYEQAWQKEAKEQSESNLGPGRSERLERACKAQRRAY